jgi:predicted glycosyltransferase
MRITVYCQQVWGVGHFFRTREILKALSGHEVLLVTGGAPLASELPAYVHELRLPPMMMDRDYTRLFSVERDRPPAEVRRERSFMLRQGFARHPCDIFLVEFYPFGRNAFRHEIQPLLDAIRRGAFGPVRVACSLRDILVEKKDPQAYERRVLDSLNGNFDAVLIHADPHLVRLEETFRRAADIAVPQVYTGFVTPRPGEGARQRLRTALGIADHERLVVASAGGGQIGARLLGPLLEGLCRSGMPAGVHLHAFTGPYMDPDDARRLMAMSQVRCQVARFADNFIDLLAAADLSVSMGGYNTCMNVLASGVPALIWPSPLDREQRLRARRLERIGAAAVLHESQFEASQLARSVVEQLATAPRRRVALDLDGAHHTAEWLARWHALPSGGFPDPPALLGGHRPEAHRRPLQHPAGDMPEEHRPAS